MRKFLTANFIVVVSALAVFVLLAGPLAAKPSSHPVLGQINLTEEQRQEIQNLRGAFRDEVDSLDWSVTEEGHDAETLQQWRELRMALRDEIREVLTEEQREAMDAARRGTCPYSGKTAPASTEQTTTLFL